MQLTSKIANQNPNKDYPRKSTPTSINNTCTLSNKSKTIINRHLICRKPYTFEERHASLSEPSVPVFRRAPLSEPQYKPTHKFCPSLQQDLNRSKHLSQKYNLHTLITPDAIEI